MIDIQIATRIDTRKIRFFLTALFAVASGGAGAAIDALNFATAEQEADYHQLTQELRCPQCQNNNIADSNATIAVDMRGKVFELLQAGKSKTEIIDYMVQRYGHFVTYDPPLTAATLVLWLAPLALLLFGGVWFVSGRKRRQGAAQNETAPGEMALTAEEQQRLAALLNHKDNP